MSTIITGKKLLPLKDVIESFIIALEGIDNLNKTIRYVTMVVGQRYLYEVSNSREYQITITGTTIELYGENASRDDIIQRIGVISTWNYLSPVVAVTFEKKK